MFLYFIPQVWYNKTYIFWIRSIIIWYWLLFVTFVMWLAPYIGWGRYVWEEFLIINIRYCFLNELLGHYKIVINFLNSCTITIFQENNSNTRKRNLERYIAPFPWLIVMNIPNLFVKLVIGRNNDELFRQYSGLKNFPHPQVLMHPHEISSHSSTIYTKQTTVSIVKILVFGCKYGTRLVIYTRTKNIIYRIVGKNHLIHNGYLIDTIEK